MQWSFGRAVREYARGVQSNFSVSLYFTLQTELWLRTHVASWYIVCTERKRRRFMRLSERNDKFHYDETNGTTNDGHVGRTSPGKLLGITRH